MSDQDFFFDEDEAPAEKPAEKPAAKQGDSKPAAAASRPKATVPAGGQTVTMTVAGLIGVVALLVGVIIGIVIPTGGAQDPVPVGGMPPGAGMSDPGQARPLSPEEMDGDLPPGHPPIGEMDGGMPGADATETPAPEGEGE